MSDQMILIEDRDRVRTLTLNRPEKLNAYTTQVAEALFAAIVSADRDDAINALVITGAGRGFCAGLDLTQNREVQAPSRWERLDDLSWIGRQALLIRGATKPVIAAVNGVAVGAGLSLALNCDVRLMAAGARLSTGYARRGLSPDGGMSWQLPRLIGMSRATELILSGRDVLAEEALAIGLVAAVYPDTEFREQAHAYVAHLAANAPLGMANSKKLLAQSLENPFESQLRLEVQFIRQGFQTEDVREGLSAFAEKRKPVFQGR